MSHHERMNGTGYPHGTPKEEISLPGRVVPIADSFDPLTTKPVYKDAIRAFDALVIMRDDMESHFDQDILREFINLWNEGGLSIN